jgi:predicted dehydrogenase
MTAPLRVAIIGLGMGTSHAQGYLQVPEAQLVAVADADPKRLERIIEPNGKETYVTKLGRENCFTDYKEMLKSAKPDLVSVALPNFLHAPVSIDCLKSGAHVLCEKPMAMTVVQAKQMIAVSKKVRRKLGINLSYRFTPQGRALKDLADKGFLGTPYHASTRWTRRDGFPGFGSWFGIKSRSGGGPLIDLGVHRIDLAMWLMGCPEPATVSGMTHDLIAQEKAKALKKEYDCEDLAAGFIRFKNGASMTLEISWGGHQAEAEKMNTTVMGTKGTLVHRNEGGGYNFVGEYFYQLNGNKLNGTVAAANPSIRSSYGEMVRAILNDTKPIADAEDGLRIQRVLNGLYQSAATGREVRVGS